MKVPSSTLPAVRLGLRLYSMMLAESQEKQNREMAVLSCAPFIPPAVLKTLPIQYIDEMQPWKPCWFLKYLTEHDGMQGTQHASRLQTGVPCQLQGPQRSSTQILQWFGQLFWGILAANPPKKYTCVCFSLFSRIIATIVMKSRTFPSPHSNAKVFFAVCNAFPANAKNLAMCFLIAGGSTTGRGPVSNLCVSPIL